MVLLMINIQCAPICKAYDVSLSTFHIYNFMYCFKEAKLMWKYLDDVLYDKFLLSFNLIMNNDIKKTKKLLYYLSNNIDTI